MLICSFKKLFTFLFLNQIVDLRGSNMKGIIEMLRETYEAYEVLIAKQKIKEEKKNITFSKKRENINLMNY